MSAGREQLVRLANWLGYPMTGPQLETFERYAGWLADEAIPAGGLGPAEGPRIWDRHICDSVAFAVGWPAVPPPTAVDVGTGVGLPGIPLAILWPMTAWTLIDRAGRRIDLARRAVRILELENVLVAHADLDESIELFEAVVARGVRPPETIVASTAHLVSSTGRTAVGLSRSRAEPISAPGVGTIATVPIEVLDGGAQILIIDSRDR